MHEQCIALEHGEMKNKKSSDWRRWLKLSVVTLPFSLVSVAASAGIIGVGFETTGSATRGASCGPSCTELGLTGATSVSGLDSYFGASGTPDFTFSALLNVTPGWWAGSSAVGKAPTGGWRLWDGSGDSLYGSVDGWLSGTPADLAGAGLFDFGVTGGTGLLAGITGSGGALAGFSRDGDFRDAGMLLIRSDPTVSVPEPSTLALLAFGLAALGWSVRKRQRRAMSG
jgi:hypothetical protein